MLKIKSVRLQGKDITVKIRKNSLARRVKISIDQEGLVSLTVPRFVPERMAETFLLSKTDWILTQLDKISTIRLQTNLLRKKYPDYKSSRRQALEILKNKINEVNEFYGFKFGKITVKNQKTCWGSCSRRGNLNFNYKLAFMDPKYADYVITHELCHLKELNHSKRFWELVARRLPDYKKIQKEMRSQGLALR